MLEPTLVTNGSNSSNPASYPQCDVRNPFAALNPAVAMSASESTDASVGIPSTPMRPVSANTGREAIIDGNEKGVQFPVAKARSNTVPLSAIESITGVWRSSS